MVVASPVPWKTSVPSDQVAAFNVRVQDIVGQYADAGYRITWVGGMTDAEIRRLHDARAIEAHRRDAQPFLVDVRVAAIGVGPNSDMTGTSNATAKNRGPLSVVTSSRLRRTQALLKPTESSSSGNPVTRESAASGSSRRSSAGTRRIRSNG